MIKEEWFSLIDKMIDETEPSQPYINYKMYTTKSGKVVNLEFMTYDAIRNCMNYVNRTITYPNREGYLDMMKRLITSKMLSEGFSQKQVEDYINGGEV